MLTSVLHYIARFVFELFFREKWIVVYRNFCVRFNQCWGSLSEYPNR